MIFTNDYVVYTLPCSCEGIIALSKVLNQFIRLKMAVIFLSFVHKISRLQSNLLLKYLSQNRDGTDKNSVKSIELFQKKGETVSL